MRTFRRIACLATAVLSLAVWPAPPAEAASVVSWTFTGEWIVGCGFGYPVITGSTLPTEGPTCGVAGVSEVCIGELVSAKRASTATFCAFNLSGYMTGYCGLASGGGGSGGGGWGLNMNFGTQVFAMSYGWTNIGNLIFLTGTMTDQVTGQSGPLSAVMEMFNPTPVLTPQGGSCFTGTSTFHTLAGQAQAVLT